MSFTLNDNPEVTDVPATIPGTGDGATGTGGAVPPLGDGVVVEDAGAKTPGEIPPTPEVTPPTEEVKTEPSEVVHYWSGEAVEIQVADDVVAALQEKGIDAHVIAAELYAKDGEFKLSEDSMNKLYEAFGKFSVDAYLSGLKSQNEMFYMRTANDAREAEAADAARFNDVSKECGGEAGWTALESFALETLSDEELTMFNGVMESGNAYLQQYAVRELESRRKAAQGDAKPNLIEPTGGAPADSETGPLSASDYQKELMKIGSTFGRDKRGAAEAQAKLDARRRAGMAAGL